MGASRKNLLPKYLHPENSVLIVPEAVSIFLKDYAEHSCSEWTFKTYISIFKTNIVPYFNSNNLADIGIEDVEKFHSYLINKCLSDSRIKNTMALLNQLIHYFQEQGIIEKTCDFKVKRIKKAPVQRRALTTDEVKNILKLTKKQDKILYKILSDISRSGKSFSNVITKSDKSGKLLYLQENRSKRMQEKKLREKFRKIKLELGLEKIKFDTLKDVLKGKL